ncbi:MAG: hypothetical protein MPJ22_06475 [Pirellulales bacterium]|nr:hypothetical protein [Pirellulales bacterium]
MRVQVPPLAHDAAGWKLFDVLPLVEWFVVQMPAWKEALPTDRTGHHLGEVDTTFQC